VSLSYKPDPSDLFYATISRGFRSGGFNNTTRAAFGTYPAETLLNYELGAKSSFLDDRLKIEGAVFHMIDRNRPDFFFYVVDSTQNIFPIAKSRIDGVELNLAARPLRSLTLTAGFSQLFTRILDIDTTAVDPDPAHSGLGKHLPYVYHTQFNTSAQYTRTISGDLQAMLGTDFSLKANNWFWYTNTGFKQAPIPLLNAYGSIEFRGAEVRLFAMNVFNHSYVSSHDPNFAFGFDQDDAYPAPPRRWGVSLTYRF
jgi:iron complex outermembrane receptor protein